MLLTRTDGEGRIDGERPPGDDHDAYLAHRASNAREQAFYKHVSWAANHIQAGAGD